MNTDNNEWAAGPDMENPNGRGLSRWTYRGSEAKLKAVDKREAMTYRLEIKEKPILFSTPMIKALLAGTKTQTRRVIKPQPPEGCTVGRITLGCEDPKPEWVLCDAEDGDPVDFECPKPRYQVGDELWVKETYWVGIPFDGDIYYKADWPDTMHNGMQVHTKPIVMLAEHTPPSWKSGRFMFKKYARLWLRVTKVRMQRLQDISSDDCLDEGLDTPYWGDVANQDLVRKYAFLWDSINGKTHPWALNPFVWVYSFERIARL